MPIQPVAHEQLGERVARQLRRMIVTGELPRETVIVADDLAAKFGVSRGPVRDAVRQLTAEGLIATRGRRAVIRGLLAEDVDELYSLRHLLETAALRRAMDTDLDGLVDALDQPLEEMRRAVSNGGYEAFPTADAEFHTRFFAFSDHMRLTTIWAQYRPSVETVLLVSRITWNKQLGPSYERHVLLRDIIRSGDRAAAAQELASHLTDARQRVRQSLHEDADAPASSGIDLFAG